MRRACERARRKLFRSSGKTSSRTLAWAVAALAAKCSSPRSPNSKLGCHASMTAFSRLPKPGHAGLNGIPVPLAMPITDRTSAKRHMPIRSRLQSARLSSADNDYQVIASSGLLRLSQAFYTGYSIYGRGVNRYDFLGDVENSVRPPAARWAAYGLVPPAVRQPLFGQVPHSPASGHVQELPATPHPGATSAPSRLICVSPRPRTASLRPRRVGREHRFARSRSVMATQ